MNNSFVYEKHIERTFTVDIDEFKTVLEYLSEKNDYLDEDDIINDAIFYHDEDFTMHYDGMKVTLRELEMYFPSEEYDRVVDFLYEVAYEIFDTFK